MGCVVLKSYFLNISMIFFHCQFYRHYSIHSKNKGKLFYIYLRPLLFSFCRTKTSRFHISEISFTSKCSVLCQRTKASIFPEDLSERGKTSCINYEMAPNWTARSWYFRFILLHVIGHSLMWTFFVVLGFLFVFPLSFMSIDNFSIFPLVQEKTWLFSLRIFWLNI